uniref:Protein kinase domain-containing protein n=1 Tax=Leersia perrieri TaxID=77586 RepID=A0A0D9WJB3_9ORYZ
MAAAAMSQRRQWTRVRTLGRGASGAEVFLAADDATGDLFAVKSAPAASAAAVRREQALMSRLASPHVVPCIGGGDGSDGSYQMLLEFAPGGSLADAGRLDDDEIRGFAGDVARGLAYLHGLGIVHGDVKARNVVIGVDGCAKLADFGCARRAGEGGIIGGTPAFMAPEVARGEEQGAAADVWALGCVVVEMATGRSPWRDMDVLAAVHRIGFTDAVPEIPIWLSADAKDFLGRCLQRRAVDRSTAAQLLDHPFLAAAVAGKPESAKGGNWVSPKSTLDAALWESDIDDEEEDDDVLRSTAERIGSLACSASSLPDWESDDDGWIDVISKSITTIEASSSTITTTSPADEETSTATELDGDVTTTAEFELPQIDANNVGETNAQHMISPSNLVFDQVVRCSCKPSFCNNRHNAIESSIESPSCFLLPNVSVPHIASRASHFYRCEIYRLNSRQRQLAWCASANEPRGRVDKTPMDATGISGGRMRRLRTLGRGASGAVVSLFAAGDGDGDGGELIAVKSAAGKAAAAQLRREGGILASLSSPHVLPCLGFGAVAGGEFRLVLEFAPGGSLADEVARHGGGRLGEDEIRGFAGDVARGLAYLHGMGIVHGDVKARNVVIGGDGRAMLADFGCARRAGDDPPGRIIGGTPAFMAPEVARGEEQGAAADVWALGCVVVEMATGAAPWRDMDGAADVVAAVRRIGFADDAVPEIPEWISPEGKDFLEKCFRRRAGERWTAAQLLEHPFLAFAGGAAVTAAEGTKAKWVSPKSTLDAAFWEFDADDEEDDDDVSPESSSERIMALAGDCTALPDWESDDGWIDVMSSNCEFPIAGVETPAEIPEAAAEGSPAVETKTSYDEIVWDEGSDEEMDADVDDDDDELVHNHNVGDDDDAFGDEQLQDIYFDFTSDPIVLPVDISDGRKVKLLPPIPHCLCSCPFPIVSLTNLTIL